MAILLNVLLLLHLLGMAAIVGGYLGAVRSPRVTPGMKHGAYLQLLTGLLLVGVTEMSGGEVNNVKIAIKVVLALVVAVAAIVGARAQKKAAAAVPAGEAVPSASGTLAHVAGAAAVLAVIVAVFV